MLLNVIVIIVLVVILFFALRGSIKHLKGQGSCCGGNSIVEESDKKLDGPVIKTKGFKIEGMHCENCTNRIKRAINRIDGVSAKLSLKKNEAVVQYEKDVADEVLTTEIEELGYKVTEIR